MFNLIVCPIKRGIRFCENMNIHIKKNQNLGIAVIVAVLLVSFCGVLALSESSEASATDPLISGVTGTAGTDTLEVTIGATVVNATIITIDYGDESVAATVTATDDVISSTYTYTTAGTYTVTITATDGTVTDTVTASYVTSTGTWTNNYTITFDVLATGVTAIATQTVASGAFAVDPATTVVGSTAIWYSDAALTTVFAYTTAITANTTLYLGLISDTTYTVTFSGIDGVEAQTVASGAYATIPALTSTTGTITWLTDSEDATTIFAFETTAITADITLYYHFVATAASTTDDGGILDDIIDGITSFWNGIVSFFESIWNGIVSFFTDVWNGIVKYI